MPLRGIKIVKKIPNLKISRKLSLLDFLILALFTMSPFSCPYSSPPSDHSQTATSLQSVRIIEPIPPAKGWRNAGTDGALPLELHCQS